MRRRGDARPPPIARRASAARAQLTGRGGVFMNRECFAERRCRAAPIAGFTLIELLVVITIIGVLLGLLLPAVQAAREASRRSRCANNLHQLGIAIQSYHAQYRSFPPGAFLHSAQNQKSISWRVLILPYLEESVVYEQIQPSPNGGAADWEAESKIIDTLTCPSAAPLIESPSLLQNSNYSGVGGVGRNNHRLPLSDITFCGDINTDGVFYPNSHTRIAQIEDGTSKTLAIGERTYIFLPWMYGAEWTGKPPFRICTGAANNIRYPINADANQFGYYVGDGGAPPSGKFTMLLNDLFFGSNHAGGAQFCFADGSIHMLADSIDFTVFGDMSTVGGGETNSSDP
jgi:prepilin-type N-terminal cleavage/methylation domain-containing protein/prepilin-type processing-associated H-X9-DG protein